MKWLALSILCLVASLMLTVAHADGSINWQGQGSENVPCANGAHWVLAPAFGIESATLHVDADTFEMQQSGQGSWSADSGEVTDASVVFVEYVGSGDERDHLQLSHCLESSETPTPTPTDSPSPTPTDSPSPSPSHTPSNSSSPHEISTPTAHNSDLASTGLSRGALQAAGLLTIVGLGALFVARKLTQ